MKAYKVISLRSRAEPNGQILQIGGSDIHRRVRFGRMEAFRQGLQDTGLVEGRDVIIELRFAQGGPQQLAELAAELVRLKVDVTRIRRSCAPRSTAGDRDNPHRRDHR
jgi:hypothetical protein